MRVSVRHWQKTGGLGFGHVHYCVSVSVSFRAQEYDALLAVRDYVILERGPDSLNRKRFADWDADSASALFSLKLSDLLEGTDTYTLATPLEARAYDTQLREAFANLKTYLDANFPALSGAYELEF